MPPLISRKQKVEVVNMNSQGNNVEEKPEHRSYEIKYSERVSYGRLKE